MKTCIGLVKITTKQAKKLHLDAYRRTSYNLEQNCLLLASNESFENVAKDLEQLTGLKIGKSTVHRQAIAYEVPEPKTKKRVKALSVDGGNIRVRTPKGEASVWKNYKAIQIHDDLGLASFQDNQKIEQWINQQPLGRTVTCLGDGHDGIWNIVAKIGNSFQRREVLDWYHLKQNLYRIGGSLKRLCRAENNLWHGDIEAALAEFNECKSKQKQLSNFRDYLKRHQERIPDYSLYQLLSIPIGSGAVESLIKRINQRVKITGAQWKYENISQILKLRCAYLNYHGCLSNYA